MREFGAGMMTAGRHVCRLTGLLILTSTLSGCAVHYRNPQTGAEHLLGFGQLRLKTGETNHPANLTAVISGVRVPGLCVAVGRDHFGFTLGYLDRQRLAVVPSAELSRLAWPTNRTGIFHPRAVNSRWAFGHIRMCGVGSPNRHLAIVTGKALAGLGAGVGGGDTGLGLVASGRQLAVIQDENIHMELDQDAPRWPGFDLFATRVRTALPATLQQPSNQENP